VKPTIVVSGVNLVDMGPLSVYRDALSSLVACFSDKYEIVALVHRKGLLGVPGVTYIEFPDIKAKWLRRIRFEYFDCLALSKSIQPVFWLSMHDMTPRVHCNRQAVYCHNPSPFYRFSLREARLDPSFGMFMLFYRFLYRLFLHRNEAVIVQQNWIRDAFRKQYGAEHVIVAQPTVELPEHVISKSGNKEPGLYRFFYPAHSRTFKNHQLLLQAVKRLEDHGVTGYELILTVDASSNRCGAELFRRFGHLNSVRWLGSVSRDRVYELYGQSDCLLFPSKLETWGLPLTEFKSTGKPILAVDLPYAYETIGSYDKVCFFHANDPEGLASMMEAAMHGSLELQSITAAPIAEPYAKDWAALWKLLLPQNE
jgi:glycosyltransferase involved in cell wall biosynthesis